MLFAAPTQDCIPCLFPPPQLELAAGGIKTNGQLQTSDPNVYAVGDVAAFPLLATGGAPARQEHIVNARMSAKHAVNAILGE